MIEIKKFSNGFEYLNINNGSAYAKIALQGAHIFKYAEIEKEPLLWVSELSEFREGEEIFGGIPVCWPWFGLAKNSALPIHGFARVSKWGLFSSSEPNDNNSEIILKLTHNKKTLKMWPYKFELYLKIVVSDNLTMELTTINRDSKTLELTQGFHTFFAISDIKDIAVSGLEGKSYLNYITKEWDMQRGEVEPIDEINNIYMNTASPITLYDNNRSVKIESSGSASTVIWNPYREKSAQISQLTDSAYREFVCIEATNTLKDTRTLKPNESHTLKTTFKYENLD